MLSKVSVDEVIYALKYFETRQLQPPIICPPWKMILRGLCGWRI